MYIRNLTADSFERETYFLWGPRQTGKSTLLRSLFPEALYYDLLLSDVYRDLLGKPSLIREYCHAKGLIGETQKYPIIIDEIQLIPELLNEVHWLIENKKLYFILCGSSARKLKRGHGNLLGGRALRTELYPLTSHEIPDFDLVKALNNGLLPRMYNAKNAKRILKAYIGDYLKEEIAAEGLVRNIRSFNRFLEIAGISNNEIINYSNIASECSIDAKTVKDYFTILEDTLLGSYLPALRKTKKRRIIESPKFYLFDVGIAGALSERNDIKPKSEVFGKAFEHFIFMELKAHSSYKQKDYAINYWRTSSGFEVDFILNTGEIAIEVKSSSSVNYRQIKGLRAFKEEHNPKRLIVVSLDSLPRKTEDNIEILPWMNFLEQLWQGELI